MGWELAIRPMFRITRGKAFQFLGQAPKTATYVEQSCMNKNPKGDTPVSQKALKDSS